MRAIGRLIRLLLASLVFVPLLPAAAAVGAAPATTAFYTVTDLGTLDGGQPTAFSINDAGIVVGMVAYPENRTRAFRWQSGQLLPLGTLGGTTSAANAINAAGVIAGNAARPDGSEHAALFDGSTVRDLGTLGGDFSYVMDINALGTVIGISALGDPRGGIAGFIYRGGAMRSLGTYQGDFINPEAINDAGQIVANVGGDRAVLIDATGTRELGTLGGKNTTAIDINAGGTIVGYSTISQSHAPFFLPSHAFSYRDGQLSDLGTLPGYSGSAANGINEAGQIVGGATDVQHNLAVATLFQDGQVIDLNALIPADSGWRLTLARAINNRGQIVGDGMINGQKRAFLLTPRFPDVAPGSPYFDAIVALTERGIIQGYADGRFGPSDLVLRAQSAALIARAAGWDAENWSDADFPDRGPIDDDLWRNVRTLAHYGVAQGYADGTYDPTGPVLHQQAILFITRALVEKGFWKLADDTAPYPNLPNGTAREQADRRAIATYVREAGAIPDRPLGQPWADWNTPATRGWYAQVLYQALATLPSTQPIP